MLQVSSLFLYKLMFMVNLIAAQTMFLFRLNKKPRYGVRITLCTAFSFVFVFFFPILAYNALYSSFMFFTFFVLTILTTKTCYDINWRSCIFCTVAGYSVQHLASVLYDIVITVGLFDNAAQMYSDAVASTIKPLNMLILAEVYALVYWCMYHLLGRRIKRNEDLTIKSPSLLALLVLVVLVEIVLNAFVIYRKYESLDMAYYMASSITNVICSVSVLVMQFELLLRKTLENELGIVYQMWHQEQKQFLITKETIDLINMKYHDLKHRSEALSARGAAALEEKAELDRALEGYSALVKTGSEVLDVILSEKMLLCRERGIEMTCMADGQGLGFIRTHHLYALLGNAIDNAVEAVEGLPQEKRVISLFVRSLGNLAHIHVENYYEGPLALRGGLPATTKGEKDYHGYGMPSMRAIAEQYGGTLSISAEGGIFLLDIIMAQQWDAGDS